MSRAPIETRPSTAQWLIASREAAGFNNAPDFLADVKAQMGSAPSYSTYASWEAGSTTPRARNLKVIRDYYGKREDAGALPKQGASLEERAVLAAEAQVAAINRQTEAIEAQTRVLSVLLAHAVAPDDRAALDSWVHAMLDSSSPRNPAHPVA